MVKRIEIPTILSIDIDVDDTAQLILRQDPYLHIEFTVYDTPVNGVKTQFYTGFESSSSHLPSDFMLKVWHLAGVFTRVEELRREQAQRGETPV